MTYCHPNPAIRFPTPMPVLQWLCSHLLPSVPVRTWSSEMTPCYLKSIICCLDQEFLLCPCFDKYSGFGLLFTHWFAVFPFRLFVPLQTDFTWYLDLYLKCPLLEHSGYTFRFTHLDFFTTQRSGLKPKPSPHILRAKTKARLRWRPEMQLWDTTAETWIRPRMYHPENFWNDY